jgi:hypothetical protein
MSCELVCNSCPVNIKRNCGVWIIDAYANPSKTISKEPVVHTQTRVQLHTRIDAKSMSRKLVGSSAGGFGGGVPPAIEMDPGLYTTDHLKAERALVK